jgi:hypothetical protein
MHSTKFIPGLAAYYQTKKQARLSADSDDHNDRNDEEFRKRMGQWFKEIRDSVPAVDAGIFPHDDDDKDKQKDEK